MKTRFFLSLALLTAALDGAILKISPNSATRQVATEVDGNYSTTHLYIDEVAADSIPVTIFFNPEMAGVETCEVFTNLNRRNRAQLDADGDGIEDGIKPVSGGLIAAGNDGHYYKAYPMTSVAGGYQLTLPATATGAYRLTARWRLTTDAAGFYRYYTGDFGDLAFRAHAIVVSPKSARQLQLYVANPLTIISTGTLPSQRGTFADLANGVAGGPRFNLEYVKKLGCNMLWFQPIHPNGIAGRQIDPATGQPFEVGSPYAVKNFFEVMPLMAKAFTPGGTPASNDTPAGRVQALAEFQSFSAAADAQGVGLMLDAPFNHTSYDAELAAAGQALFTGAGPGQEIRNTEARFFAQAGAYDMRASSAGNIAIAPDRIAEFQFSDTYEVFFGRYAALVSGTTGGPQNTGDWFDYSTNTGLFDNITQNVWRYFAEYTLHWLTQTGYPANPSGVPLASSTGVDALRADFAQGLPPQCWEYIINKTRTRRWDFVFMAESLDGGAVTYRSGRHFDILNENIVFPLHAAQNTTQFRQIYEDRRNQYGQALVLLNTSSHDEDHYQDPFHALLRHAVNASIDGVPLVFPGQELGLSGTVVPPNDTNPALTSFGYDRFEINSNKPIPHFKKYNSLMPLWLKTTPGDPGYNYGLAQISKVYEGLGQARRFSNALRASNRFFLNLKDGTPQGQIFSVAKFESRNAAPNVSDVVLAFVNLDRNANPVTVGANKFNVAIDADGNGVNDFGIKPARQYNVKNIAAYLGTDPNRRNDFLIPNGISGSDLTSQGLYVAMNRVPQTDGAWASAPYEAQFLKLYDVTPPPAAQIPQPELAMFGTVLGDQITFSWLPVSDPEGGVPSYRVQIGTTPGGSDVFDGTVTANSKTVTVPFGTTLHARVQQLNAAGIAGAFGGDSTAVVALDPAADADGDGQRNAAEFTAGTDPRSGISVLKIISISRAEGDVSLTAATVSGKNYRLETQLTLDAGPWTDVGPVVPATGAATQFVHAGGAGDGKRFYRVRVVAP